MKHIKSPLRPGMTAMAAALALSAAPLFAQDAIPAEPAPPVVAAPPAALMATETVQPVLSAPAALNIPQISVNMDDAPAEAKETATPAVAARANPQPVKRSETATPVERSTPETQAPAQTIEVAPEPTVPLTSPEMTMAPPPVEPIVPVPATRTETAGVDSEEILPIAGGVLGALALVGGGLAFAGRRRRHRQAIDARVAIMEEPLALTTPVSERPETARSPISAPMTGQQAATSLPAGFDITRFGPHVQAAYQGPTSDNPSLSLRTRLKRARFYDQRARMSAAGEVQATAPVTISQAPETRPERKTEFVTSRRLGTGHVGFRPAFQN